MNKVILIGNLARAPELRTTANGVSVCNFTIAVNRRYLNPQGVREADFIPIVAWRQLAENCAKFLDKGRKCAVSGSLQTRSYEAPDGSKRYITEVMADEVEFVDRPSQQNQDGHSAGYGQQAPQHSSPAFGGEEFSSIDDDELPF